MILGRSWIGTPAASSAGRLALLAVLTLAGILLHSGAVPDARGNPAIPGKVVPSDGATGDGFGTSIATLAVPDSTIAVVGSPNRAGGGAAYVFSRQGADWSQVTTLYPSAPIAGGAFGSAVATGGNRIAVSDPPASKVYVYKLVSGT